MMIMEFDEQKMMNPTQQRRLEDLQAKEVELTRRHEEVILRREALMRGTEKYWDSQERRSASFIADYSQAKERNLQLLKDLHELQRDIRDALDDTGTSRFNNLKQNYWSMVRNVFPVWYEELQAYEQKTLRTPRTPRTLQPSPPRTLQPSPTPRTMGSTRDSTDTLEPVPPLDLDLSQGDEKLRTPRKPISPRPPASPRNLESPKHPRSARLSPRTTIQDFAVTQEIVEAEIVPQVSRPRSARRSPSPSTSKVIGSRPGSAGPDSRPGSSLADSRPGSAGSGRRTPKTVTYPGEEELETTAVYDPDDAPSSRSHTSHTKKKKSKKSHKEKKSKK